MLGTGCNASSNLVRSQPTLLWDVVLRRQALPWSPRRLLWQKRNIRKVNIQEEREGPERKGRMSPKGNGSIQAR
jgi:hypothetical protein